MNMSLVSSGEEGITWMNIQRGRSLGVCSLLIQTFTQSHFQPYGSATCGVSTSWVFPKFCGENHVASCISQVSSKKIEIIPEMWKGKKRISKCKKKLWLLDWWRGNQEGTRNSGKGSPCPQDWDSDFFFFCEMLTMASCSYHLLYKVITLPLTIFSILYFIARALFIL